MFYKSGETKMIEQLKGVIESKNDLFLILSMNGIGLNLKMLLR